MARLRAVMTIDPPGLGGSPLLAEPTFHRRRERVLDGLLGEPDVAEEAGQGGDAAAELGPVRRC
jgi:hypothetical protein